MEGVPRNDWEALQQGVVEGSLEYQHRYIEPEATWDLRKEGQKRFKDPAESMMAFGKAMAHSAAAMGQTLEEFRSAQENHAHGRCSSGCGEPRNREERRADKRAMRKRGRPYVRAN